MNLAIDKVVIGVMVGAITGAGIALLGYAKNETAEDFDYKKAVETVFVGACVGGVGGYMGLTYTDAQELLVGVGGITLIEYAWKVISRKIFKWTSKKA